MEHPTWLDILGALLRWIGTWLSIVVPIAVAIVIVVMVAAQL